MSHLGSQPPGGDRCSWGTFDINKEEILKNLKEERECTRVSLRVHVLEKVVKRVHMWGHQNLFVGVYVCVCLKGVCVLYIHPLLSFFQSSVHTSQLSVSGGL